MSIALAVLAATLVMFAVGAIWYTFLFQKEWGKIHGFDKLTKKEQQLLMSQMGTVYGAQFGATIVTAIALVWFDVHLKHQSWPVVAVMLWLGFVLPTQVSGELFSRTEQKYKLEQILIMSSEALIRIFLAAWVVSLF